MEKPLNLKMEEIKNELTNIINNSKLPAYILKPILKDICIQLQNLEQTELIQAQKQYEENLSKEKETKKEE